MSVSRGRFLQSTLLFNQVKLSLKQRTSAHHSPLEQHRLSTYLIVCKKWTKQLIFFGVCLCSGEIIQQKLDHKTCSKCCQTENKNFRPKTSLLNLDCIDWRLVGHVTTAGMLGNGCVCCLWYNHIFDRIITPGFTAKILTKRVFVDNLVAGGSCLVVFYACLALLEKSSVKEKVLQNFGHSYLASWTYWVPVQYVNFRWFPPELRVNFVAMATFIWSVLLCIIKNPNFLSTLTAAP